MLAPASYGPRCPGTAPSTQLQQAANDGSALPPAVQLGNGRQQQRPTLVRSISSWKQCNQPLEPEPAPFNAAAAAAIAAAATIGCARRGRRSGNQALMRSLVAAAAKVKAKKKKAKFSADAVAKAMAALEKIEAQPQPKKEKKERKSRDKGKSEDLENKEPEAETQPPKTEAPPVSEAEPPAQQDNGAKKRNRRKNKGKQQEEEDAQQAQPEAAPPQVVAATQPVEEAKEEAPEEQPQPEVQEPEMKEPEVQEPEVQEPQAVVEPPEEGQKEEPQEAPETQPPEQMMQARLEQPEERREEKPQAKPKRNSLLSEAFKKLKNIEIKPEATSLASRPMGKRGTIDELVGKFSARPKPKESEVSKGNNPFGGKFVPAEELAMLDSEEDDEDDEDEYDKPIIQRRRGEGDQVSFELETSSTKKGAGEEVALGLKSIMVRRGGRMVLQDASWVCKTGDKIAMVGSNGCGKTTQLKVLTSELMYEEGSLYFSRPGLNLSVLEQSFVDEMDLDNTVRQELMSAVPKQAEVVTGLERVEAQLDELPEDAPEREKLVTELTNLQVKAEELRVHELVPRMEAIIAAAGFLPEDMDTQVKLFSGGWKVRIGLSKIFMTAPDALLLDEPTNHLDLESVEWLEEFLQKQTLPIVLVSHDREFMDRVCNKVVETVEGMTYTYKGNYTDYVKQREQKMETWKEKYQLQQKQITELQKYIKQNKNVQALANARMRKQKDLDKIMQPENYVEPPPRFYKRIKFEFPLADEGGRRSGGAASRAALCGIVDVTHGYGDGVDATLFQKADFRVRPGEKIGIVGRNGAGKSTLLRLLMGEETPSVPGGKIYPADPKNSRFFTQHQADLLPYDKSAIEVVKEANELDMDEKDMLELLKKFRFKNDRLDIKCADLSGGEKARLAIVRMMLSPAKLLVLDEPTNHLDVTMKETLEYALREYPGGVVVVSHDRWFLSQTCTKIYAIENKEVKEYQGDFRYYMDSNEDIRKKVEKHYMKGTGGIGSVPDSLAILKAKNRGQIKKNQVFGADRDALIAETYGRKLVGGRLVRKKYSVFQ